MDPPIQPLFFKLLPLEIRQAVYHEVWKMEGLVQHIFQFQPPEPLGHIHCVTDPNAWNAESMHKLLHKLRGRDASNDEIMKHFYKWARRMWTPWCKHWLCEAELSSPGFSSFLSILLTCRTMYYESCDLMYQRVEFSFMSVDALIRFMQTTPEHSLNRIRSVRLNWKIPVDVYHHYVHGIDYLPQSEAEATRNPTIPNEVVTQRKNDLENMWSRMATTMHALQDLHFSLTPEFTMQRLPPAGWFHQFNVLDKIPHFVLELNCELADNSVLLGLEGARGQAVYGEGSPFKRVEIVPGFLNSGVKMNFVAFSWSRSVERDPYEQWADQRRGEIQRGRDFSGYYSLYLNGR